MGAKWSPEQRAKFLATMAAKKRLKPGKILRGAGGVSVPVLVLSRKLKRQVVARIAEDGDIGELETTALLLVQALRARG